MTTKAPMTATQKILARACLRVHTPLRMQIDTAATGDLQ